MVTSGSVTQHEEHLKTLFERLTKYGVVINLSKCGVNSIEYLGRTIEARGVSPPADRVRAICEFKQPQTIRELRLFIGPINVYRRFVKNAASLQAPL